MYSKESLQVCEALTYRNSKGSLCLKPKWRKSPILKTDMWKTFVKETDFVQGDIMDTKVMMRRIYCVLHNLLEEPKCAYSKCNNVCSFKNLDEGYGKFCGSGKGCNTKYEIEDLGKTPEMNSREAIERRKQTTKKVLLEKYGVDNPTKIPEVKRKLAQKAKEQGAIEKMRERLREKYGVDNAMHIPEVKQKVLDKVNSRPDRARKISETLKAKYRSDPEFQIRLQRICEERSYRDRLKFAKEKIFNPENLKHYEPLFTPEEYALHGNYMKKMKYRCKYCGRVFEGNWNNGRPKCICQYGKKDD